MKRKPYPSDCSDAQWENIAHLLGQPNGKGRPRKYTDRECYDAILYVNATGCQWRHLPHDFPPWETVYGRFYRWRKAGVWQRIHDSLRRTLRQLEGRDAEPSAAILDSQTVKTTEQGGPRGYDAGTKIDGRKRHVLVDTMGLVLAVIVTSASVQDRDGAKMLLERVRTRLPRLQLIWADSAYGGQLIDWVKRTCHWVLQTVLRPVGVEGWVLLPRRWVVERTFSWLNRNRRMLKDYERLPETTEAWIPIAMIRLMSRRILPQPDN